MSAAAGPTVFGPKKKKKGRPVKNAAESMINERACQPSSPLRPPPRLLFRQTANIYLVVYPGSMQSWMSATQEFFCSESMVSRMYSPPFSTCGGSQTLRSHTRRAPLTHTLPASPCKLRLTQSKQVWRRGCGTFRTKVLSLSGISSGMVVLTSTMADRGMLTLGFED